MYYIWDFPHALHRNLSYRSITCIITWVDNKHRQVVYTDVPIHALHVYAVSMWCNHSNSSHTVKYSSMIGAWKITLNNHWPNHDYMHTAWKIQSDESLCPFPKWQQFCSAPSSPVRHWTLHAEKDDTIFHIYTLHNYGRFKAPTSSAENFGWWHSINHVVMVTFSSTLDTSLVWQSQN